MVSTRSVSPSLSGLRSGSGGTDCAERNAPIDGATLIASLAILIATICTESRGRELVEADDSLASSETSYDCGTIALYTLLRLSGRPTELSVLETRLPLPKAAGYSMLELRNAAYACGLSCAGMRVSKSDRQPAAPILAFLTDGTHGHYVVVRPVGHTGKLVQVLNLNRESVVLDAADLYGSPEWTGLALIPDPPRWLRAGS